MMREVTQQGEYLPRQRQTCQAVNWYSSGRKTHLL